MRGILITIVLIIMIGASIHFSDIDLEKLPEEIAFVFLEQLLSANPDSNSEISDTDVFNKTNIESYISLNYSSIATEKMMKDLYKNNYVMLSSDIAEDTNSNVKFYDMEITDKHNSDGQVSFNFRGATKVTSIDTLEEVSCLLTGEIALIKDNKNLKVDTLRIFTNELIDYK